MRGRVSVRSFPLPDNKADKPIAVGGGFIFWSSYKIQDHYDVRIRYLSTEYSVLRMDKRFTNAPLLAHPVTPFSIVSCRTAWNLPTLNRTHYGVHRAPLRILAIFFLPGSCRFRLLWVWGFSTEHLELARVKQLAKSHVHGDPIQPSDLQDTWMGMSLAAGNHC